MGRQDNPDIADLRNTVRKMALKRCHVDCTIRATAASDFLTQDLEDLPAGMIRHPEPQHGHAESSPGPKTESAPPAKQRSAPSSEGKAPAKTPPVDHSKADASAALFTVAAEAKKLGIADDILDEAFAKATNSDKMPWREHPANILIGAAKRRGWEKILGLCDAVIAERTAKPADDDQRPDPEPEPEEESLFAE